MALAPLALLTSPPARQRESERRPLAEQTGSRQIIRSRGTVSPGESRCGGRPRQPGASFAATRTITASSHRARNRSPLSILSVGGSGFAGSAHRTRWRRGRGRGLLATDALGISPSSRARHHRKWPIPSHRPELGVKSGTDPLPNAATQRKIRSTPRPDISDAHYGTTRPWIARAIHGRASVPFRARWASSGGASLKPSQRPATSTAARTRRPGGSGSATGKAGPGARRSFDSTPVAFRGSVGPRSVITGHESPQPVQSVRRSPFAVRRSPS